MALEPLDVWMLFENRDDEEPTHEANTFKDGDIFRVDCYHVDVGQVMSSYHSSYSEAQVWLEKSGFLDFTA